MKSNNGDMAHLYLTIKRIQNQQSEAVLSDAFSNSIAINPPQLRQLVSNRSRSLSSHFFDDHKVEDLEMLLEAYCMQLDGIRNKILLVREYIGDTEDYVTIQLDSQQNGTHSTSIDIDHSIVCYKY